MLLGTFSLLSSTQVGKCSDGGHDSLISYPDLLSKTCQVVRKFSFFVWLDCERMTRVLSSARAMRVQFILCKVFSTIRVYLNKNFH